MHLSDLDFGKQGIQVRFRADNENAARAKAGYGRDRARLCASLAAGTY